MNAISRKAFVAVAVTTALFMTSQAAEAQQSAPTIAEAATASTAGDRQTSRVIDVALEEDGIVRGRVLHADGRPIDGSRVILRKGDRIIAAVISEQDGQFSIKGLTGGVYHIETPTGHGTYRFWTRDAAPPAAMTRALLVSKEPVLRGQFGYFTPQETFILAVGATGLAVGVIALEELDDQEGKLNRLMLQVSRIPVSP